MALLPLSLALSLISGNATNFITLRTAGKTIVHAADPNPHAGLATRYPNGNFVVSTWTDPAPKGLAVFIPAVAYLAMGMPLHDQNFLPNERDDPVRGRYILATTVALVHITPRAALHLVGVVKDDTPDPNVYLYPGNQGHSLAAVQGAVMAGALYPPARLVMLDVPQRPFCCAPMDSVLTRFVGASKSRSVLDQCWHEPLPGYVPTTGALGFQHDCYHFRTNAYLFIVAAGGVYLSWGPLMLNATVLCMLMRYRVGKWIERARAKTKAYGEDAFLVGEFEHLRSLDFRVHPGLDVNELPEPTRSWMSHFRSRPVDTPLGLALLALCQCAPRIVFSKSESRNTASVPCQRVAEFLSGSLAHDYYKKGAGNRILVSHASAAELEELEGAYSPFPKSRDVAKLAVEWTLSRNEHATKAARAAKKAEARAEELRDSDAVKKLRQFRAAS